ncbi:alpha/beta hydrolase [Nocardia cyriacigeorgica]|uniref:Alpha/beta hydrolase n=1 Tax=Nocardia cyriacigeorgica TaxID=135487 RepID=A0A6P1D4N8_9NOCA|nr:alpha/beta hydrolase [Nocardia cyriacigeorgica]NEW37566.1 alpha/beta hydrolase [Nocardia cyriacigeorgica]NEW45008.1 alpha/beta hydrolase [Nocardia cyriacigeorgica]NEW49046.1 alpha/beta hydrolase [Nocardia cyriacigeorgica]NEW55147.1 alpha/beta hydrolase [Nocardia cyriacigeorgica]
MATTRSTATSQLATAVPTAPTLRSRLALVSGRYLIRPINCALPHNRWGIHAARGLVAAIMAVGGPTPPGTQVTQVRSGQVRGEWVCAAGVEFGDRAIYFVHGSGYVICSARTHRGLAARLSHETGLPVFVIDYRLAPEHLFPAAADDVAAGYRWLLGNGYRAADVVIAGDSAGGHLTMDLLLENARTSIAQPAGAVLFSPLIDLSFQLAEHHQRRGTEAMASARVGRRAAELYIAESAADSPRLQLTIPPGTALPPLFVQASDAEMLVGDAIRLRDMAVAAGVPCELELWPGQIHVFQALPLIVPEAAPALHRAAHFVTDSLAGSAASTRERVS